MFERVTRVGGIAEQRRSADPFPAGAVNRLAEWPRVTVKVRCRSRIKIFMVEWGRRETVAFDGRQWPRAEVREREKWRNPNVGCSEIARDGNAAGSVTVS